MPIVGLDSFHRKEEDDNNKKGNEYYAGGVGSQGGGSGLAVVGKKFENDDKVIMVTLYKNGYKVGAQEFCKNNDTEQHKRFYNSLLQHYVPHEIEDDVRKEDKTVVLIDRKTEDYVIPPPRFGYVGNKLGTSPSPSSEHSSTSSERKHLQYDASKPKTAIRVRSCLGRVLTIEVTEDWDYEDLYNAVSDQTPGLQFTLLGGFPPKKLECDSTNVLATGLGGTAIRQVRQ